VDRVVAPAGFVLMAVGERASQARDADDVGVFTGEVQQPLVAAADEHRHASLQRPRVDELRVLGDDALADRCHRVAREQAADHASRSGRQRRPSAASISRVARSRGDGYGAPDIVHWAGVWPAPIPSWARPRDSTSSVATSDAIWTGSRTPVLSTYVPRPIFVVTAAVAASATNGDATMPGWSATSSASKPAFSACLARFAQVTASRG